MKSFPYILLLVITHLISTLVYSQELEEFKIKRKEVFEFTQAPKIEKIAADTYDISFTVKDYCDVTIVIEDSASGKILRHLISGVLGSNAPKPLESNTLSQKIRWDGKNDEGEYIDTLANCHVRVSLGLKPVYEKRLYQTNYRRMSNIAPILTVDENGVYTFEALGSEFIKHYDHKGNYIKTIYPFPANKIKDVKGLKYFKSLKDGKMYPEKLGYNQATFLTAGTSCGGDTGNHMGGYAATAMTVRNGHLALAFERLNRLGTDGTSKGLDFNGPSVSIPVKNSKGVANREIGPTSIAFSPDNKYLYLTGYVFKTDYWEYSSDCLHVVYRMEYAKNEPPTIFKGKVERDSGIGSDNESFSAPVSVSVDNQGRVYIADYGNDRIQVYSQDGQYLKTIKTPLPSKVEINPKTQEIIVFSYKTIGPSPTIQKSKNLNINKIGDTTFRNLGTFEKPQEGPKETLPFQEIDLSGGWIDSGGQAVQVAYNPYDKEPTIWSVGRKPTMSSDEFRWAGSSTKKLEGWNARGIRLLQKKENQWNVVVDFAEKANKDIKRVTPPPFASQRLMFNPSDGNLYIGEDVGFWKSFDELVRVNPETGEISLQPIPFDAAAIVFGYHDIAYLRAESVILRVNSKTWKEIAWDYGIEKNNIYYQTFGAPRRSANAISALPVPGAKPVHWQLGAMSLNVKGDLAVVGYAPNKPVPNTSAKIAPMYRDQLASKDTYKLKVYPGRGRYYFINVWDKYGNLLHEDAFPGMPYTDGVGIDKDGDLYTLIGAVRYINEDKKFKEFTETLVKTKPGKSRIISSTDKAEVPLPKSEEPKRNPDLNIHLGVGKSWIEQPEWIYGGVAHGAQGGCACWHSEFTLDYFGRSFIPEADQYQIAIIDSAGNLIMRIGQYSNADSYGPNSPIPLGGNEIGLMLAHYVGVETDKRLFISDTGNERILSVKLNYEVNSLIPLKGN